MNFDKINGNAISNLYVLLSCLNIFFAAISALINCDISKLFLEINLVLQSHDLLFEDKYSFLIILAVSIVQDLLRPI